MSENFTEGLCEWLKKTKGITKIHIEDLVSYIPEYEQYLEDSKIEWNANQIKCDLCGHNWLGVYPEDIDRLECPNCNNMVMFEKL
jgi:hypothetical protein